MVVKDEEGVGEEIAEELRRRGEEVIEVGRGEDASEELKKEAERGGVIDELVHCLSITANDDPRTGIDAVSDAQYNGCYSVHLIARTLAAEGISNPMQLTVITNQTLEVESGDVARAEKATILGPCKVIPQEIPNISCRCIDIVVPGSRDVQGSMLIERLVDEITASSSDTVIAHRGNKRWVQSYEPARLERESKVVRPLRENGVYLITGGLGGVGLLLAEYLARALSARLVLVGRSALPDRGEWENWLATHGEDVVSLRIRKVQELEELGTEIMLAGADVANEDQMRSVISQAEARFGQINGVLHAAGVTIGPSLFTPITELGPEEYEQQFGPKVYGVYVLEKLLAGKEIDFCLLFSSNASVLGGL